MKNIIITGGTGGIGGYIVKKLQQKYHITVLGRNQSQYNSLKLSNKNVKFYALDISSESQIKLFFSKYRKNFSTLNGLINAAAVQPPIGNFIDNSSVAWSENLKINLFGSLNMIRYAIPLLKNNNHNKIINFSGGGATSARPGFSAYAVSKTGIVKMTEILASELKKYLIDINVVAPGAVNTRMLKEILDSREKITELEYDYALDREKTGGDPPNKIYELCEFLLSIKSNGISGKFISAVWDPWIKKSFQEKLKKDENFATLRRIDGYNYSKV